MKKFKEFLREEEYKQKLAVSDEAARRLKFENEVMGKEKTLQQFDRDALRTIELANQIEYEREQKYPEEAELRKIDERKRNIILGLWGAVDKLPPNMPGVSPLVTYLSAKEQEVYDDLTYNPTSMYGDRRTLFKKYRNDFDTGMPEPNVRRAPDAVASPENKN